MLALKHLGVNFLLFQGVPKLVSGCVVLCFGLCSMLFSVRRCGQSGSADCVCVVYCFIILVSGDLRVCSWGSFLFRGTRGPPKQYKQVL